MDSNLYSRNYNHSETCPSPRASHGISVTCLQGVLICSCLTTVAFREGAVWKDVVTSDVGIGKWVLKNHTRKQASAVFVLPPSHMNDVSPGERSSRNRSRDQCSGEEKQGTGKTPKMELCPHLPRQSIPYLIWGDWALEIRRETSKPIAFLPFVTRLPANKLILCHRHP